MEKISKTTSFWLFAYNFIQIAVTFKTLIQIWQANMENILRKNHISVKKKKNHSSALQNVDTSLKFQDFSLRLKKHKDFWTIQK